MVRDAALAEAGDYRSNPEPRAPTALPGPAFRQALRTAEAPSYGLAPVPAVPARGEYFSNIPGSAISFSIASISIGTNDDRFS